MKYNIAADGATPLSVTVFADRPMVANSDHENFNSIVAALMVGAPDEEVLELFDVAVSISNLFRLSERISADHGHVYFDGDEVHGVLVDTILRLRAEHSPDWDRLVLFMEKINMNPNEHSRENLYRWLNNFSFEIAADGDLIAYKGVSNDGKGGYISASRGHAIVDGVHYNGQIPNALGSVVEMPRSEVAFDPSQGCSSGLHVGTWNYAKDYAAGAFLRVKINPRDVVSVPTEASDQKMRVCRYVVTEIIQNQDMHPSSMQYELPMGVEHDYEDDSEWEDDDLWWDNRETSLDMMLDIHPISELRLHSMNYSLWNLVHNLAPQIPEIDFPQISRDEIRALAHNMGLKNVSQYRKSYLMDWIRDNA